MSIRIDWNRTELNRDTSAVFRIPPSGCTNCFTFNTFFNLRWLRGLLSTGHLPVIVRGNSHQCMERLLTYRQKSSRQSRTPRATTDQPGYIRTAVLLPRGCLEIECGRHYVGLDNRPLSWQPRGLCPRVQTWRTCLLARRRWDDVIAEFIEVHGFVAIVSCISHGPRIIISSHRSSKSLSPSPTNIVELWLR